MIKTISNIEGSPGIILDPEELELAGLKVGDELLVSVEELGVITMTPVGNEIGEVEAGKSAAKLIQGNSELFRKLA